MTTFALLALMPVTLAPIQETVGLGIFKGGNLASWAADDNDPRLVCKFFVPSMPTPFLKVRLLYDTGTTIVPQTLEFRVKVSHHTPGPLSLYLSMRRETGAYEFMSVMDAPIVDGTTYVGLPQLPPEYYVRAGGLMESLIEVWQRGPWTSLLPCVSFEFANLVLTY